MQNKELIVKNLLISYLQKIGFSSIIKKTRVLTQKFMEEKCSERPLSCTDMLF